MAGERLIDARGLEPPEPFVRAMEALDLLDRGECAALQLHLDREPFPLYRVLDEHGYPRQTTQGADGSFVVRIEPRSRP